MRRTKKTRRGRNRRPRNTDTPIIIKTTPEVTVPRGESVAYELTRDGLFIVRQNQFYHSCVRARGWPRHLASQEPFFQSRFPRLSISQFELIVGFFSEVGLDHSAEAAVLLGWDPKEEQVRIVVPPQIAEVTRTRHGDRYPGNLRYEVPAYDPGELLVFGDIHSHVRAPAYASATDVHDEMHRPGLHVVVGRIDQEPPEFHAEAVVDGTRFKMDMDLVAGGYRKRSTNIPQEWLDAVTVDVLDSTWSWTDSWGHNVVEGSH